MRSGFHVAKLFGIHIHVDWSWIFIFLLITWNLAAGVFPSLHPEWGLGMNLSMAALASLLFFASVLAHELAHSLVAKARGLPVRRITLFLFGGVSNIQREPEDPKTEFLIAAVGPLTSILLGIIFLVIGGAGIPGLGQLTQQNTTGFLASLDPFKTLLLWLGPINISLGIFNLIPGFPLDGGRILRSILWGITDNLPRATRWAAGVGQVIAWLFIITGIAMAFGVDVPIFGRGVIGGIWLAFIGWFLNNAAVQSYQQVVVQDMLEGVPVSRLMRSDVQSVSPDMTLSELVDSYIMGTEERAFPVAEGDRLAGIISLEDVRKIPQPNWDITKVRQVMTPADQVEWVSPKEDVSDALDKLTNREIRSVPVLQNGQLVGILRSRDILKWLQLHSGSPAK